MSMELEKLYVKLRILTSQEFWHQDQQEMMSKNGDIAKKSPLQTLKFIGVVLIDNNDPTTNHLPAYSLSGKEPPWLAHA